MARISTIFARTRSRRRELFLENISKERNERKFFEKIFKRPKNREDGSDFDDFRTNSIAATRTISGKMFARTGERKNERTSDRTDEKSEKKNHLVTSRK